MIYIFDIDGTLADITHRLHFIQQEPKDWDSFFINCVDDEPIPEIIRIAQALFPAAQIFMLSGRSEVIRMETVNWLAGARIPCDLLMLRKEGDHREDSIVKADMLREVRDHFPEETIEGVFEDRKQVVDMYRAKGLRVFQVAEGNF
jgi:hypothetical protein